MTLLLRLIAGLLLAITLGQPAQTSSHTLMVGGIERHYLLYLPSNLSPSQPTPLLLVLHGGGGTAQGMVRLTNGGFQPQADANGFIVVSPDGINHHWNDGRDPRGRSSDADDVGFIQALIEQISSQYAVDPKRVYVTGISNGGMMAYRLACDLSGLIDGIAPVAALMPDMQGHPCAPTHPIAVFILTGTADPIVPYDGGTVGGLLLERGDVASADMTLQFWAAANHCLGDPIVSDLPDAAPNDGTSVRETRYENCDAPVALDTIIGGGHTWPGGWQYLGERLIGKTSREFDGSTVIWNWFQSLQEG
ncbi:MAG: hypothetical protein GC204_05305 [Chloroflexi bacterium]|nr:hypothetical protein [Chloroflexota bacterium]